MRRGIELGFFKGRAIVYDGTEPVAIDAQAGKGKLARFLGVNLVSPRTAHFTKIVTDLKDAELAWVSWKTLRAQGYRVRFINPGQLYGYPGETYNLNTRLLDIAARPALHALADDAAYDCAAFLVPVDSAAHHAWVGQGVRMFFAKYYKIAALHPSPRWPCTPGGLADFYLRQAKAIRENLTLWAATGAMAEDSGVLRMLAGLTTSRDQWNAYASMMLERLRGYQPGAAARLATDRNSFDPAEMKTVPTALFIIGDTGSEMSRAFVGAMTAAIVERFAGAYGPLRALIVGEEWGQLYVANFPHILTLYRQGGVNFLGVFQNAPGQIDARYGRETTRLWRKAAAHTLYRGLPDGDTLRDIEHRSGRTSVMVRGFNVNNSQVNGSGDSLVEQARPLLQVEDIRAATGGAQALLDSRDAGFFRVDVPNFWERPEMDGRLRDVRQKPDKHAWLRDRMPMLPLPSPDMENDADIEAVLAGLRRSTN